MFDKLPDYVTFTDDVSSALQKQLSVLNPDKIGLLVDENTKENCLPLVHIKYDLLIELQSGETNKTLVSCEQIWQAMTQAQFTRKSVLINLGGGVIGDMGGFAAATYKRGIRFINVPTTLLSQVDASIGGKLGVDFQGLKNHIGVFQIPGHVIVAPSFLATLPKRQLTSGYAEVIKHGLIYDESHWKKLEETPFDSLDWLQIIEYSIGIKHTIVSQDPLENGLRKILNFGHTLGHAIESASFQTDAPLLHGEAIAIGMILESYLSIKHGDLKESHIEQIENHLAERFELPKELPDYAQLEKYLMQDKKNEAETLNFSLLETIGRCNYDIGVDPEDINDSLKTYHQMNRSS